MGIPAGELRLVGAADPVQQPTGVIDPGIGAHKVEHRSGVVDQVVGKLDGAGEGVGIDRPVPTVVQVAGQVQQAGQPSGGAGEFGRPAGQVREVAAVGG